VSEHDEDGNSHQRDVADQMQRAHPGWMIVFGSYSRMFLNPCHCGCGESTDRDFLPGHDVRAMQARVREHFNSSPRQFIQWVDAMLASTAAPKKNADS
jgi:hypothetical protein